VAKSHPYRKSLACASVVVRIWVEFQFVVSSTARGAVRDRLSDRVKGPATADFGFVFVGFCRTEFKVAFAAIEASISFLTCDAQLPPGPRLQFLGFRGPCGSRGSFGMSQK